MSNSNNPNNPNNPPQKAPPVDPTNDPQKKQADEQSRSKRTPDSASPIKASSKANKPAARMHGAAMQRPRFPGVAEVGDSL